MGSNMILEKDKNNAPNGLGRDNPGFIKDNIILAIEQQKDKNGNVRKGEGLDNKEDEEGSSSDRDTWDSPIEFLLSCISMSVGLGNVWRFPFTAYSNGGGAFLIPYLIVLIVIGRPMYFLEMTLGQFASLGQVKVWRMVPLSKGVGYGSIIATVCTVSFYAAIMGQTVFYFFASFAEKLPWTVCDKSWGGDLCDEDGNTTWKANNETIASLYYRLEAFPQKDDISDGLGLPNWRLTLCLLASWVVIFFSLWKGVKSSGKVAYFTAIFPYVVLIILLVRGVTLPGASTGLIYLITPQWEKLYDPNVWYAAVSQCFFSLATGFGSIIMFSSYNPFRHTIYRDAWIISIMDSFTSILAACVVFSVLGHFSEETGRDIATVTDGGPGLAFITYPEAIAQFAWVPQLFAVLFFLMLFTLGIGSANSMVGSVITILMDQCPSWRRPLVTLACCVVGFLTGLIYVTQGGPQMTEIVDHFGVSLVIYVCSIAEAASVAYLYGISNIARDIEFMLGIRIGYYWKFCWTITIPLGLTGILIYSLINQGQLSHHGIPYPDLIIYCGWTLAVVALGFLPGMAIHSILTRKGSNSIIEKFREALMPTKEWGPADPKLKKEWEEFKISYTS